MSEREAEQKEEPIGNEPDDTSEDADIPASELFGNEPYEADETDEAEDGESGEDDQQEREEKQKVDDDIAEKARQWDAMNEAFSRDPEGFVKRLLESLPQSQKADDIPDVDPMTEMEEVIKPHLSKIANLDREIDRRLYDTVIPHIDARGVETAILYELVGVLASVSGVELPSIDPLEVMKAVKPGEPYRDAVKRTLGKKLDSAAKKAVQSRKPRPTTPGNRGAAVPPIEEGERMADFMKRIGVL